MLTALWDDWHLRHKGWGLSQRRLLARPGLDERCADGSTRPREIRAAQGQHWLLAVEGGTWCCPPTSTPKLGAR